ncbi:hypothetical protein JCM8547_006667 [Rhodosporidiobolus lusitaniae]
MSTDLSAFQPLIDDVLSPLVIACFLSFAGCGIVLSLIFQYYSGFSHKDRPAFLYLVGAVGILVTFDTACHGAWTYKWSVEGFMNPLLLTEIPWEMVAYCFCTGLGVVICQSFYIWRIWIVSSRRNIPLVAVLTSILLGGFGCEMRLAHFCITNDQLATFTQVQPVVWAWTSLVMVNDILITASMYYYLVYKRNKERSQAAEVSESPLARIVNRCVQTNALSTGLQALIMVLIGAFPNSQNFGILAWLECCVYGGSLVATLNARASSHDSLGFDSTSHGASTTPARGFGAKSRLNTTTRTGLQSMQVQVDHEVDIAVEVDPNPVWRPTTAGNDERYAVRFDRTEEKDRDVEKGSVVSEKNGGRFEDVELATYSP